MANFIYAGVQAGKKIGGEISASDLKSASTKLRQQKIIVTSIKKGNGNTDNNTKSDALADIPISDAPIIFDKGRHLTSLIDI